MSVAPSRRDHKASASLPLAPVLEEYTTIVHEDLMTCAGCGGPVLNRLIRHQQGDPWPNGWVHLESGAFCRFSGAVLDLMTRHHPAAYSSERSDSECPLCGQPNDEPYGIHQTCIGREQWQATQATRG